jgi:hypothetical protein
MRLSESAQLHTQHPRTTFAGESHWYLHFEDIVHEKFRVFCFLPEFP